MNLANMQNALEKRANPQQLVLIAEKSFTDSSTNDKQIQNINSAISLLIRYGANVNAVEPSKYTNEPITAIHAALYSHNITTVKIFISHGSDINLRCANQTALMYAVKFYHEAIQLLLDAGADTNQVDDNCLNAMLKQNFTHENVCTIIKSLTGYGFRISQIQSEDIIRKLIDSSLSRKNYDLLNKLVRDSIIEPTQISIQGKKPNPTDFEEITIVFTHRCAEYLAKYKMIEIYGPYPQGKSQYDQVSYLLTDKRLHCDAKNIYNSILKRYYEPSIERHGQIMNNFLMH